MKSKVIISSILTIVMCFSLIAGSTFALFTSSSEVNIAVTSGSVTMTASIADVTTESMGVAQDDGKFANGGEAIVNGGAVSFERMTPGDKVSFKIVGTNTSSVSILYRYSVTVEDGFDLVEGMIITIGENEYSKLSSYTSAWGTLAAETDMTSVSVSIELPETAGNEYQGLDAKILIKVEAVQGNATVTGEEKVVLFDTWDGTSTDTSWYDDAEENATVYTISTAEQLASLSTFASRPTTVDENGEEQLEEFVGKTIKLAADIDLYNVDENGDRVSFKPIGGVADGYAFQGTFDGQGHTVSNLFQSGWDLGYYYGQSCGMGLFGWIGDSTIKNVNLDNAEISMEAVVMGGIAGYAAGDCTFENINVTNTQIANYNWDTGGIVGQVYGSGSNFVFKNITVDATNTISGHWGTWDVSAGGIIGRTADGVTVEMENITVAAVLDVYNDACAAYQWFAYRYSGMIVGYTKTTATDENGRTYATADHITCKNVTVIYGEWALYTYCQPSNVSPQYVRVQGGYSTDPYYSGRHWTAGVDANGNKMVDDNHVHTEDQAHNVLLPFDQLFGGGQGVYGNPVHDGVTVIYNYDRSLIQD